MSAPRVLLAVAILLAGALAPTAQSQAPSGRDLLSCDDYGDWFGFEPIPLDECGTLAELDAATGAEPDRGCEGSKLPLEACVPTSPLHAKMPSVADLFQCYETGGPLAAAGLPDDETMGLCALAYGIDTFGGGRETVGCEGFNGALVCVPDDTVTASADAPDLGAAEVCLYLAIENVWAACYFALTGQQPPAGCGNPNPLHGEEFDPQACAAALDDIDPGSGVPPVPTDQLPPLPAVAGCQAELLYPEGRGPIAISSNLDLLPGPAAVNGVCPATEDGPAYIPPFTVDAEQPGMSATGPVPPGDVLTIKDTTQELHVLGTNLLGASLLIDGASNLLLDSLDAPGLHVRIVDASNVTLRGSTIASLEVIGGDNVAVLGGRIGDGEATPVRAQDVDGLGLNGVILVAANATPLVDASGASLALGTLRVSGTVRGAPCVASADGTWLALGLVDLGVSCPDGLIEAEATDIAAMQLSGQADSAAATAAAFTSDGSILLLGGALRGGSSVLRLAGPGDWAVFGAQLTGNGLALLELAEAGPGVVAGSHLQGEGALLLASGDAPAASERPEVVVFDNRITRSTPEAVGAATGLFDDHVELSLYVDPFLAANATNVRGGRWFAGNWWERVQGDLWDGDGDGLAEQQKSLVGTAATDVAPLVEPNWAPFVMMAQMDPDPFEPFSSIQAGQAIALDGVAYDREDGLVDALHWELDGVRVGDGGTTTISAPAPGLHEMRLVARDTQNATDSWVIDFSVLPANAPATVTGPFFGPCAASATPTGQAPALRVGQETCLRLTATDPAAGLDDPLDLLYLDDGDGTVDGSDVRLVRSPARAAAPGMAGNSFDTGATLIPKAGRIVLWDYDGEPQPLLRLGPGDALQAGDVWLGDYIQGMRLQEHHFPVGLPTTAACAPMPIGLAGTQPVLDLDCSGSVTAGDVRIGGVPRVRATDPDVGAPLSPGPTRVMFYDRDADLSVLWSLDTRSSSQTAAGQQARLTPATADAAAMLTVIVTDEGETASPVVHQIPIAVHSDLPPVARIVVSPTITTPTVQGGVSRNQPVTLADASTPAPATPITAWSWSVTGPGVAATSSAASLQLAFPNVGSYQVQLTVTGANGLTSSVQQALTVLQAPPVSRLEAVPALPAPAGTPIEFTAQGSSDIGRPLVAAAGTLDDLAEAAWESQKLWFLDVDGDLALDAGEPTFGLGLGVVGVPNEPAQVTALDVRVCVADRNGDGAAGRTPSLVEELFLSAVPCTQSMPGQVRLQGVLGATSSDRLPGTFVRVGSSDVGLTLVELPDAELRQLASGGHLVLDVDGDGVALEAEDIRLSPYGGRLAGSRVLPPSLADGGGSLSYLWRCLQGCGAGATTLSNAGRFTWEFETSGQKVIELTLTDASGNVLRQTLGLVVANSPPLADLSFGPARPSQVVPVEFDASGSLDADSEPGATLTYTWDFGDNETATTLTPFFTKTYGAPGLYTVSLTVTDGDALQPLSDVIVRHVRVFNELPTAAFEFLPAQPQTLTPVALVAFDGARLSRDVDDTIPNPGGYRWTIERDGGVVEATGPLASQVFGRAGEYDVTLRVTDSRGGSSTVTKTIEVANRPPTAVATVSQAVGRAPQALQFSADLSSDPEVPGAAGLQSALWDFGDGSATSSQFNPTHIYTRRGQFTVTLTVADLDGAVAQTRLNVTMINEPAVATLVLPPSGLVGQELTLRALAFDQDGDAVTYTWDFGDQTAGSGAEVKHTYTRHGTYTVTLRARDDGGGETVVSKTLAITSPPPKATVVVTPTTVDVNGEVRVSGNATDDGTVSGHFIEFGDGTSTFAATGTHRYSKPGTYTVTYRATDNAGESGAATQKVTVVNPAPVLSPITVVPAQALPGDLLLFRANATDEDVGLRYRWDFKDGTVSESATPVHAYRVSGTFNVVLEVTDAHGAKATRTLDVVVGADPAGNPLQPDTAPGSNVKLDVEREGRQDMPAAPLGVALVALAALALARRRR